MAEGAEPLKPLVAILLRALLISNSVVAGFRGEKMESENEPTMQALIEIAIKYEDELSEEQLDSLYWAIGTADMELNQ